MICPVHVELPAAPSQEERSSWRMEKPVLMGTVRSIL